MTKYFAMMSVRVVCFVLMVTITPYGWYTWVFAVGAIVLPYIAVVVANVASATREEGAVPPERALPASAGSPTPTGVIRIQENPAAISPPDEA